MGDTRLLDRTWMDRALCAGRDPEMWYSDTAGTQRARRICLACPVRNDCLTHALTLEGWTGLGYRFGIWGGLTPWERWWITHHRPRGTT